ncbi:MAG: helix-turn-helix domain-containing protein [Arenimonas sp.]
MASDDDTGIRPRSRAGIGLRIQQLRRELGLSQAALAEAIERKTDTRASRNQVSQWETSRAPSPQDSIIKAIASILGVSARWLATGEGPRGDARGDQQIDRAVQIACWAVDVKKIGPPGLAAAIMQVREALAEDANASDRVLARVARLASRAALKD